MKQKSLLLLLIMVFLTSPAAYPQQENKIPGGKAVVMTEREFIDMVKDMASTCGYT